MRIGNTIYFDHQATTPVDERVYAAMVPYFCEQFGNSHSTDHVMGWTTAEAVERARLSISKLIGSGPDEVIFTSGATESNNLALLGFTRHSHSKSRHRILLSTIEHKSILEVGRILSEQYDYQIGYLPVDQEGFIDLDVLAREIDENVLLVSVMAVNNEIGTIQNMRKVSSICRKFGVIFHSDCAQAPCALPLKEFANFVDFLSLSAHKMYGPKGIGVLYTRREYMDKLEPMIYGGQQQAGLRSGTLPVPLCVGIGTAAQLLLNDDASSERQRLSSLRDRLITSLQELPWQITLNGPQGNWRHPGNANLVFSDYAAQDILGMLQPKLAASTGSACTTGIPESSHVLNAIGLSRSDSSSSIRFSIGRMTTRQDIDDAVELISHSLTKLNLI